MPQKCKQYVPCKQEIYLNNLTFNIPKIDFLYLAKLSGSGGIFAGFGKSAGFRPEPEPKSGTALL